MSKINNAKIKELRSCMLKGKHGRLIECVMETEGGFAAVGITSR